MAGWDTKPVNAGYTWVVGMTTGNYNNGNPDTYVKTWMEYLILQDETDILNNRSRIDVKLYSQVISGGSGTGMANTYTANNYGYAGFDDGNKQYLSTTYNFNGFALNKFADTTLTIPHNADGTKTINLQAAFTTLAGTWSITGGSVSASITLPTIVRGTTLTNITNRYYGYPATFELNRRSGSLWEQVWVECGVYSYHVVNNQANPNFTLTIPRDCTPNTAKPSSSSWTITIYTYSGSTLIDTASYSGWTWEINSADTSYLPTLSATPTFAPYNDVVSQFGTYVAVAGYSKLRLSATKEQISTKYGAEVSIVSRSVTFSGGGGTVSDVNASTYTSNIYMAAGNITCTYTFTDSRGFSNSWTSPPINVKSYSAPTLNVSECYRGDSSQNVSDSGTYAWGTASYSICTLAGSDNINRNSVASFTAQVTGFSVVNPTSGVRALLASGLSLSSVYTVTFSVTDITGHTATETRTIPSEDVPIHIREGGKGVGIGAYCEGEGLISVGYQFSGTIKSKGGRIFGTCNLIDQAEQGEIDGSTGEDTSVNSTVRLRSPFSSKLSPSTTYTISHLPSSVYVVRIFFYTSSKSFISATYLDTPWDYSFTTPSNCYYVRFNFRQSDGSTIVPSDLTSLQLEEGSSASPYNPYAMDNVELTDAVRNGAKIPLTMSNCTAQSAWGGCWARITNNKVHIHLGLENLVSVGTSWLWISTLTTQLIPKNWVVGNGWSLDGSLSGNNPCVVMLDSSGNLYVCCTQYSSVIADFEYFLD